MQLEHDDFVDLILVQLVVFHHCWLARDKFVHLLVELFKELFDTSEVDIITGEKLRENTGSSHFKDEIHSSADILGILLLEESRHLCDINLII